MHSDLESTVFSLLLLAFLSGAALGCNKSQGQHHESTVRARTSGLIDVPHDLAGFDLPVPNVGSSAEAMLQGRPFKFTEIRGTIQNQAAYSLQIVGDDIVMAFGCYTTTGSYSVTDNLVAACDGQYSIQFTTTPNSYLVNEHAVSLPPPGAYVVLPNGEFLR